MMYLKIFRLSLLAVLARSSSGLSAQLRPIATAGLMQQPSSQYFHYVQGGAIELSPVKDFGLRASYFERPPFKSAGFIDQDFFVLAQLGGVFFRKGDFQINGYGGLGKAWGYLKEESPTLGRTYPRRTDYAIRTLSLTMEASLALKSAEFSMGHSLLSGQGSEDSLESGVAWPFTLFYFSISTPVNIGGKI